jgi:polar amino acid transport system substrate-binding protein
VAGGIPGKDDMNRAIPSTVIAFAACVVAILLVLGPQSCWSAGVYDRVSKSGMVRIGLPYNLVPQGFMKPGGEWVGFEVDLAEEMARHMNLRLEKMKVNEATWSDLLSRGRIDAALCRIKHTRALESEFDFSIAYFFDAVQILVVKGQFQKPSDLKGHKIAAVQGSAAEKIAMRILRDAGDPQAEKNVVSFPDGPSCFLALGKDKVSGWIDSAITLLEYASKSPGHYQLLDASDDVEAVAVAVPQDDSAWRDLVNVTIQNMALDGSLKKIYDRWLGPDTPYPFRLRRAIEIWPE